MPILIDLLVDTQYRYKDGSIRLQFIADRTHLEAVHELDKLQNQAVRVVVLTEDESLNVQTPDTAPAEPALEREAEEPKPMSIGEAPGNLPDFTRFEYDMSLPDDIKALEYMRAKVNYILNLAFAYENRDYRNTLLAHYLNLCEEDLKNINPARFEETLDVYDYRFIYENMVQDCKLSAEKNDLPCPFITVKRAHDSFVALKKNWDIIREKLGDEIANNLHYVLRPAARDVCAARFEELLENKIKKSEICR